MADPKKTYRARDPERSSSWLKRLVKKIEHGNKFLTMRLLGRLLRIHPLDKPVPLEEISSVLIIRYDALGDAIVTTPLWRILKKIKPTIKIGVAGSYKNLELLRNDPDIDSTYDYSASSLREFISLTKEARKQQWDVVLACNFVDRTRNAIIARFSAPNGITASIGSAGKEGANRLFSRYITLPESGVPMPMVSKLQYLLRSTIELPEESVVRPSLIINSAVEKVIASTTSNILSEASATDYIVINTDANKLRKWELKKNIGLAQFIVDTFSNKVVFLISMPDQRNAIEESLKQSPNNRIRYFGTNTVEELIGLIRGASLVITPDTSTAHIASAENKPIVGFYPVANDWLPYKIPATIIVSEPGKLIDEIPLELAQTATAEMITNPPINAVRIIPSANPDKIEHRPY